MMHPRLYLLDGEPITEQGGSIVGVLITVVVIAAVIAAVLCIIRMINIYIRKKRNELRLQLIAQQNGDEEKTIIIDPFLNSGDSIEAYASQILGTRKDQQDSFYVSSNKVEFDLLGKSYLAASVCDGMGGLAGGEMASKLAVRCIDEVFRGFLKNPKGRTIPDVLSEIAVKANEAVYNYGVENCGGQMCGTTMVLAMLENNNFYWLSVGDSRIYVIRDRQIVQITNDHNYAYTLKQKVSQGIMSEDEALRMPNREALISYIGIPELDLIDLSKKPFVLKKGDIILLCSDGLTKIMSDNQICDYVSQNKDDIESLAEMLPLVSSDMHVGSQDNTTVAVVCYK